MSIVDGRAGPPPPLSRVDVAHAGALALGTMVYADFLGRTATALPPQGDAASHAIAAIEMYDRLSVGVPQAAQTLIYVKSSYPPLMYVLSAALFGPRPSAQALPLALHAILITSLLVGWVLAEALCSNVARQTQDGARACALN